MAHFQRSSPVLHNCKSYGGLKWPFRLITSRRFAHSYSILVPKVPWPLSSYDVIKFFESPWEQRFSRFTTNLLFGKTRKFDFILISTYFAYSAWNCSDIGGVFIFQYVTNFCDPKLHTIIVAIDSVKISLFVLGKKKKSKAIYTYCAWGLETNGEATVFSKGKREKRRFL